MPTLFQVQLEMMGIEQWTKQSTYLHRTYSDKVGGESDNVLVGEQSKLLCQILKKKSGLNKIQVYSSLMSRVSRTVLPFSSHGFCFWAQSGFHSSCHCICNPARGEGKKARAAHIYSFLGHKLEIICITSIHISLAQNFVLWRNPDARKAGKLAFNWEAMHP